MINKKTKGFSLAELLISLLIISIVLSAAIPTITKRMAANREYIWRWSSENNSAYFGLGANQTTILGYNAIPLSGYSITDLLVDNSATTSGVYDTTDTTYIPYNYTTDDINLGNLQFSNYGDKLSILKKTVQDNNSNFLNSHISFYTLDNNTSATTNDIKYAGRLTLDQNNIALGIGSLQSIDENNTGENTALGHFTLLRDTDGIRNTAVGKKALSFNTHGNYNTALGFASLYNLEQSTTSDNSAKSYSDINSENTAIGSLSMEQMDQGEFNTVIGSQALRANTQGNSNTAMGRGVLNSLTSGSYNTAVGSLACNMLTSGDYNICIGYQAGNSLTGNVEDSYGLYIGTGVPGDLDTSDKSQRSSIAPLISGHTRYYENGSTTYDKELVVNARKVEFRPYDNSNPTFVFHSIVGSGDDGYQETTSSTGRTGIAEFNLRDTGGGDTTSVTMYIEGLVGTDTSHEKIARIVTYDPYYASDGGSSYPLADINLNDYVMIDFPPLIGSTTDSGEIAITSKDSYTLSVNENLKIQNSDNTPYLYLFENTFSLSDANNSTRNTEFTIDLQNQNSGSSIYLDKTKVNLILTGTDNYIQLGQSSTNNTSIQNGEIQLSDLTEGYESGKVAASINYLYKKIDELQDQITGLQNSDERLKNISGENTAGLKEINALEVKNYTYKNDKDKTPHVGVIAQQLQKIFPNSVFEGKDGYLKIKTEEIFYAMVNSIKELCAKIQDLTAKITGLDKRITELENQNKILEEQNKAFEKRLEKLENKILYYEIR